VHVVATAGHVDHGKSMLVRALTGMEPDRWEAEQRRGMTIDLGFAWMTLPDGAEIAFVDVPGHERFVSNMLAGAGPAPAVLFVVAADEGWMPQSADHLAAIDALGVRHGILVITRADLADPAPALRQATVQIADTSLGPVGSNGGMEAVTVSALTGQGLPELITALGRLTARLPVPDPQAAVRLWLDRVFAIKGSGTVVTGTLQAGTVHVGDELVLTPAMRELRIRGVQSLGAPAPAVSGVARVALNLRGASTRELGRGMALVHPGRWTVTNLIDVRLTTLPPPSRPTDHRSADRRPPGQPPNRDPAHRPANVHPASELADLHPADRPANGQPPATVRLPARLTMHIGSARAVAQVRMLGNQIARLSLDRPLPLHIGDRVLLRDPGAAADRTSGRPIFGATVLDVSPPRLRGNGAAAAAAWELASWHEPPVTSDLLRRHRLLRASAASAMGLRDLPAPVSGDWLADAAHWQRLRQLLGTAVAAHAARDPLAPGLAIDAARVELDVPDRGLVEALAAWQPSGGPGERVEVNSGYLRRGHSLPAQVADAVRAVLTDLARAPFSAPDAARLSELGLDARAAAAAERAGLLRRLPGNVLLAADATDHAARILAGLPQPFTATAARQALQTTRRVVIPLLELLDTEGVTRRLADDRRIMREPTDSRHRTENDEHAG
jgi:selenocysteine-specific elongation factor